MCNHCPNDPRDAIAEAESALGGLRTLLNELPNNADVPASSVAALVGLIHDRLDPAVGKLQDFRPREIPV